MPGGVIQIASRSGTNQFHGNAYEFIRNDPMTCRLFPRKLSCVDQPGEQAC